MAGAGFNRGRQGFGQQLRPGSYRGQRGIQAELHQGFRKLATGVQAALRLQQGTGKRKSECRKCVRLFRLRQHRAAVLRGFLWFWQQRPGGGAIKNPGILGIRGFSAAALPCLGALRPGDVWTF